MNFKLVAAKLIRQYVFFFTLSYFFHYIQWNKKNVIVLVHENHDKWPSVAAVRHFAGVVTIQSIRFGYLYIFKYKHLQRFIWKKIIFSPMCGTSKIGHFFKTGGDRCLLLMCNSIKNEYVNIYIFVIFKLLKWKSII